MPDFEHGVRVNGERMRPQRGSAPTVGHPASPADDRLYTLKDLAEAVGVSYRFVREARRSGDLPAMGVGSAGGPPYVTSMQHWRAFVARAMADSESSAAVASEPAAGSRHQRARSRPVVPHDFWRHD